MGYFYYDDKGNKIGIFAGFAIRDLAKEGKITSETMIESEDGKKFRAGEVQGISFGGIGDSQSELQQQVAALRSQIDVLKQNQTIPQPQVSQRTFPGRKSRVIYVLLGLSLGLIGIHNFYANRYLIGVIEIVLTMTLLCIPISMLLVIIDLITVDEDRNGIPFASP